MIKLKVSKKNYKNALEFIEKIVPTLEKCECLYHYKGVDYLVNVGKTIKVVEVDE